MATTSTTDPAMSGSLPPPPTDVQPYDAVTAQPGQVKSADAQGYSPALLNDPKTWDITKNQTVAGQISGLVADNSPLLQRARAQSQQQANDRGLVNSSMANQAGEAAVLDTALPIAQADAQANLGATRYNADTANTFAVDNFNAKNQAAQFEADAQNKANLYNADAENTQTAANIQAQNRARELASTQRFQASLDAFDSNVKLTLDQLDNQNKLLLQTSQGAASMQTQMMSSLQALASTQYMTQATKDFWAYQILRDYQSNLSILSNIGQVQDVSTLLDIGPPPPEPKSNTRFGTPAPPPPPKPKNPKGGCCFIFLEARYGDGTLDAVVRRYRDEHMTETNRRGYYRVAEVFVPLMRKSPLFKLLVRLCMTDPLVAYGKAHYGEGSRLGLAFAPVTNFWMRTFDYLGKDHEFIRENGEVV